MVGEMIGPHHDLGRVDDPGGAHLLQRSKGNRSGDVVGQHDIATGHHDVPRPHFVGVAMREQDLLSERVAQDGCILTYATLSAGSRLAAMRVAVAQTEPRLGARERNLEACTARLEEAAKAGAELLVLPECAISGYMFNSAEEALPFADEIPGPSTELLQRECSRLGMHVVCGLLERDGEVLHNAAVLMGPDGLIGTYRKTPLPFLGVDRFVVAGDELPVWDTALGPDRHRDLLRPPLPGGDTHARPGWCGCGRAPDQLPPRRAAPDRVHHAHPGGGEPPLSAERKSHRHGAVGRVLRLEPDRRCIRRALGRSGS